jgi:uncharacterized protein
MLRLTDDEAVALLVIARRSLERAASGQSPPQGEPHAGALAEPAGAFVTLRRLGELRGCIGHVEADKPLAQTTAECAASAALLDPRFPPVTLFEVPEISIEISILSPLVDVQPGDIRLGRHGLMISSGFRRGLLLPQVPAEWGWDREQFLEQTCLKAGLPPHAWERGARIQAFTTLVIAEAGPIASHGSPARATHSSSPT